MRLIYAEELKRSIAVSALIEDQKTLEQIIDEQPTIEDRKTGKWIRGDAEKLTGSQRCSICHKACYKGNDYFNYCPNCGARMKKPMTIPEEIINSVLGYDD